VNQNRQTPDQIRHVMEEIWVRNNLGFLARYWHTASEALQKVTEDPGGFSEFRRDDSPPQHIAAVVESHLEHHNYSGVLLAYASFDEFLSVLAGNLGRATDAPIEPNDLRDRGVRRYKKFVHKVCRIPVDQIAIDWPFLEDFSAVRNAIIHANGNKSLLGNSKELERVVARRSPSLSFKHQTKLVVADSYVVECIEAIRDTAVAVHALAKPSDQGVEDE